MKYTYLCVTYTDPPVTAAPAQVLSSVFERQLGYRFHPSPGGIPHAPPYIPGTCNNHLGCLSSREGQQRLDLEVR